MSTPSPQDFPSFSTRPTLRVDLATIRANYNALKAKVGSAKIGASVKADAYGLGAEAVGKALYGAGCRIYFVATAGEGKLLRDSIGPNAAIYVLNGPAPRDRGVLLGAKLKPVINSMAQATYWASVAREVNNPPWTAIMIDTGMNRLGLSEEQVGLLARDTELWNTLNPDYIMSHLACAPNPKHPMNAAQLDKFRKLSARLPMTPMSLSNSAGIYLGKPYHFQLVRPGISLYGGQATTNAAIEVTNPVATLLAPILQIRDLKKGDTVGYNASFTAPEDMRVAVVGAGYADGVPVAHSNKGFATIHDIQVPIVGRVSMDLTIIDVTQVHLPVQLGGVVTFRGEQLQSEAAHADTIDYEMLVRLGQRCRRDYYKPNPDAHKEQRGKR